MNILGEIAVFPKLPDAIARLQELAYNLWWSWHPEAQALYATIDPKLWRTVNQNPVKFLRDVKQHRLDGAAADQDYLARYQAVFTTFDAYMDPNADTWFNQTYSDNIDEVIAYFSAEFGLHEALPIYSGGMGILSGDHCKEASDLGLPFVGMGFLYPQGYFTQRIAADGRQLAAYEKIDFSEVPATGAKDTNGDDVIIHVDLPGRTVYAKVWKIQVGRVPLYLMDTDVEKNAPEDRELSARLYGGDNEMRISQEVVLGIGGVRALRALGYRPVVWHMNEGHSAFLGLERVRELVQEQGLTFAEAAEAVRASSIFTTHTPVPAGHDAFPYELVEKFFWQYWNQLGIDREKFLDLARHDQEWGPQYSMTVLAFALSAYHNGVSELHGQVSRRMWKGLWPGTPVEQLPISHITNGVHTGTWLAPELRDLYTRYFASDWMAHVDEPDTWAAIDTVSDEALWDVHQQCKRKMIDFVRRRIQRQYIRHGAGPQRINQAAHLLDPDALTLGFARRFATYKRATLIFRDLDRLKRILNDPERPVQLIFSGKAHPKDDPGKALIQRIYELSQDPDCQGKVLFVENYDMNIARHLIAGVDVWLNNPRRPLEASGTSGQKAALSGVPNCSVLDGWWREGYDGSNGWAIGEEREYEDQDAQDEADALSLYSILEDQIVPLYYDRNARNIPSGWLERMRAAIRTCGPQFSMERMVKEYTNNLYVPAVETSSAYRGQDFDLARQIAAWKQHIRENWSSVHIEARQPLPSQIRVGEPVAIEAKVWPGHLTEDQLVAEIVFGHENSLGIIEDPRTVALHRTGSEDGALLYNGQMSVTDSGKLAVGVRVRPTHPHLVNPYELGLSRWV